MKTWSLNNFTNLSERFVIGGIKMIDLFSDCVIKVFANDTASTVSIAVEIIFSLVAIACGVILNYRFLKKLETERRNKPDGRKGNIIEPIMTLFCKIQIVFWPVRMLLSWIFHNGIIKTDLLPIWLRYVILYSLMSGRTYVAFNSFFCAFIRYLYIIHPKRSNQWDYERTGKCFKNVSFALPMVLGLVSIFAVGGIQFSGNETFDKCVESYVNKNDTYITKERLSILASTFPNYFTVSTIYILHYVVILIWLGLGMNVTEGFLYCHIFNWIKR